MTPTPEDRMSTSTEDSPPEIGWAILELMGHRKLAGFVSDGGGLLRITVYLADPSDDPEDSGLKPIATQWYGRAAIYCITATTKETCLGLAERYQPEPITRWELPERTGVGAGPEPPDAEPVDDDGFPY